MKTHTLTYIMVNLLFTLVALVNVVPADAQDTHQRALYNYRNDGEASAFLLFEIDSITYSYFDLLGVKHNDVVVQEIWTPNHVYRIPLESIDSISFREPTSEMAEEIIYGRWTNSSMSEIEENLQNTCNEDTIDIEDLVCALNTNENVDETYASEDSMTLIVKYKDNNTYSVYPINQQKDPFDEEDDYSYAPRRVLTAKSPYRRTGSKGKVAVFNYFSRQYTRKTQNQLLEYMMQDLNNHDYGVEYYSYEDMTVENIQQVKRNSQNYIAVIIISHGFSRKNELNGYDSYFVLGEAFDECNHNAGYADFIEDYRVSESEEVPFTVRFWNEGIGAFGTDARYDCAVNVNKMHLNENVIMYMGACDAYKNKDNKHGTCVGWDGPNSTAQAHVAVLFYNLMRGKSFIDAIDIRGEDFPHYQKVGNQIDIWKEDPITKSKMEHKLGGKYMLSSNLEPERLTPIKEYYRDGICYLMSNPSGIDGPFFLKDKKVNLSFMMRDVVGLDYDLYPKTIYVKATPLRSDASPKIYTYKAKDGFTYSGQYKDVEISLSENGVYVITAAVDKAFTNEILIRKPLIFVRANPFKENGDGEWDIPIQLSITSLTLTPGGQGTVDITSGSGSYTAVSNATDVAIVTVEGSKLIVKAVSEGNATIIVDDEQTGERAKIEVTVSNTNTPAGLQAVDLGLPSGTKWANMNVGAESPEDYGGYYAWGETEEKDLYDDESNYAYYQNGNYVNIGDDIAGTEYDVAHVKWGGDWQMPTHDQIQELLNNTTSTWTTQNGVNGRLFTGSNGNSIFVPASGYRWVGSLLDAGHYGSCWSSTQVPGSWCSYLAYGLYFSSGSADWSYDNRGRGQSVRPVHRK